MSTQTEIPTPLARHGSGAGAGPGGAADPVDPSWARAAHLLRLLQTSPPRLSPSARARIVSRLDERGSASEPRRARALWPAAIVAALVLFAGGAVGAAWGLAPARRLLGELLGARLGTVRTVAFARPLEASTTPLPAPVIVVPTAPVAEPVPSSHETVRPGAASPRRHLAVAPAGSAAPPSEDPIVAESRLLADALTSLRQQRDPRRALRALDEYERRFPTGALGPEASAARIDALLALGRRAQALERLETLPLEHLPRGAELRVLRGELRAGRGQLAGALEDFSAVLSMPGAPPAVAERALYGRGSCRSRAGDPAGARADLQDYLRRFPSGQFAGPAGHALLE
jgi:hypothetical protein